MSLDTILKIGNALRNAPDSLKYFKYVSPCPTNKDGNYPFCISIPVSEEFSFDWNGIKETPENKRNKLYYLRFKTSDSDGLMKYIFGDIYYQTTSTIKKNGSIEKAEAGGYRLENLGAKPPYDKSSFERGNEDFIEIIKGTEIKENLVLQKFRSSLLKDLHILETILGNISATEYFFKNPSGIDFLSLIKNEKLVRDYTIKQLIEKTSKTTLKKLNIDLDKRDLNEENENQLLEYDNGEIFIHFDFANNENWYGYKDAIKAINNKVLSDFVEESEDGWVLKKSIYKTLCSGNKKNDIQFPGFNMNSKYKSKAFTEESVEDLFYAIDFSEKGLAIAGTDILIITLPLGENLTAKDYYEFQQKNDEEKVKMENEVQQDKNIEPLFDIFENGNEDIITSFDVIFAKPKSKQPGVNYIEISGLEKSKIRNTKNRIAEIARNIYQKRKTYFRNTSKDFFGFRLSNSFKNILGSFQSDNKGKISIKANPKYQSHLLKILPLIYTDNYYSDAQLLPSFVQNVEYTIRAGDSKFNFLKFDLEFLISIQNNQKNKYMDITTSDSYQIGSLLGKLAKNFAGDKSPIKSFEKNYVGNLSRRISSIDDFIKLKNDIEQKLIMHEKTKFTYQTSFDLAQKVKEFKGVYNKEQCAFGFFESYFKPIPKKETTNLEN